MSQYKSQHLNPTLFHIQPSQYTLVSVLQSFNVIIFDGPSFSIYIKQCVQEVLWLLCRGVNFESAPPIPISLSSLSPTVMFIS